MNCSKSCISRWTSLPHRTLGNLPFHIRCRTLHGDRPRYWPASGIVYNRFMGCVPLIRSISLLLYLSNGRCFDGSQPLSTSLDLLSRCPYRCVPWSWPSYHFSSPSVFGPTSALYGFKREHRPIIPCTGSCSGFLVMIFQELGYSNHILGSERIRLSPDF